MGSPAIFSGKRTKLLSTKGILNSDASINDNDGVLNYIKNGHAEVNALGWATYKDAAGVLPVDGTGGTPTHITFTQTSTGPLGGLGSFLVTNSNSTSAQGEGASYNFTIDTKDKAKVLQINFDYLVNSGTFVAGSSGVDSDLEVYIYDVTNALIIQPSSYKLLSNNTTLTDKFSATFQTASNSTSYRLILHCPTTATAAWSIKLDNVCVCPSQYVYGSPMTDFAGVLTGNVTGTTSGSLAIGTGGGATYSVQAKRIGDEAIVKYSIRVGTSGASDVVGAYLFPFPNGMTPATFNVNETLGYGDVTVQATINPAARLICKAFSTGFIADFNDGLLLSGGGVLFTNANVTSMTIRYKVQGWSSNVQMSDSADTRVVAMKAVTTGVPTGSLSGASATIFGTIDFDTNALYNSTTGIYTVGIPGYYKVSGQVIVEGTEALNQFLTLGCYVNTTPTQLGLTRVQNTLLTSTFATVNTTVKCNAGDTISLRTNTNITSAAFANDGSAHWFTVERLSGPSAIAATETVAASYWLSANFTASTTIPINFDSKEFDSHSAVTTSATAWKFTAPISGTYLVTGIGGASTAVTSFFALYKTNSSLKLIGVSVSGSLNTYTTTIRLLAGDFIDLRPSSSQTMQGGTLQAGACSIQITRVGN